MIEKRKNRIILNFTIILMILVCTGCDLFIDGDQTGGLEVVILEDSSRSTTLVPDFDMTPVTYEIIGIGPNHASFYITDSTGDPSAWDSLAVGDWVVNIRAFNTDGEQVGIGTETVTIEADITKEITVVVVPLTGTGSLHLDFLYDADEVVNPVVSAVFTPLAGGDPLSLDFSIDERRGYAEFEEEEIPTGYYSLVLKLHDGSSYVTSQIHAVRIVKDQRTEASFDFGHTLYSVSGKVQDDDGIGIPNVVLTFSKGYGTAVTDNQGCWLKNGLDYLDGDIMITPTSLTHVIAPGSVEVNRFIDDLLFVGIETQDTVQDLVLQPETKIIQKTLYEEILSFTSMPVESRQITRAFMTETTDVMTIASDSELLELFEVGDILVTEDLPESLGGYGFLCEVLSITQEDDSVIVCLKDTVLEKAIESGVINVTSFITEEDLVESITTKARNRDFSITHKDGVHSYEYTPFSDVLISGSLQVPDITDAEVLIEFDDGLKLFKVIVSPGFSIDQSLLIGNTVEWGPEDDEDELFGIEIKMPLWGPVTLDFGIDLIGGAEFKAEAGLITGFSYERGFDIGFQYKDGNWSHVFDRTGAGMDIQQPVIMGDISACAYGGLKLTGSVDAVLAEAGLSLFVRNNVGIDVSFENTPVFSKGYGIDMYMDAGISVDLEALFIAELSWEPEPMELFRKTLSYSASGYVTDNYGDAVEGVNINFDQGYSSVQTDSNGYWFKHLLSGDVTVSPEKVNCVFYPSSRLLNDTSVDSDYSLTEQLPSPEYSLAGGTYSSNQVVTITHPDSSVIIRYTTDGSTPTESHGTTYSGPISITTTQTIKAMAYDENGHYAPSEISSAIYTINYPRVATPSFSPSPGTYGSGQVVRLSTLTSGATIRYTTNGNTPTSSYGTVYTGPFTLSSSKRVKAIAYQSGYTNSYIASGYFSISNPSLNINPSSISSGSTGQTYNFTLTATGIPYGVSSVTFAWNFGDGSSGGTGSKTVSVSNSRASTTISHSYSSNSVFGLTATVASGSTTYGSATAPITIGTPITRPEVELEVLNDWRAADSGGYGYTTDSWDISMLPSNCQFDVRYEMYDIPDRIIIEYPEGTVKYDSGWRGSSSYEDDPKYPGGISGDGTNEVLGLFRKSSSNFIKVVVIGGESGTAWDYEMRARE